MRIRQLIKEYIELDEALATKCRTPDAQYHTKISDDKIETSVDIPSKILSELNEEQVETLEKTLHNAIEMVLAPYYIKYNNTEI